MGRINRHDEIIKKQEELALEMLGKVLGKSGTDEEKIPLDLKMDIFEKIGKWVAIKNKLENDDGNGIADYKSRLREAEGVSDKRPRTARRGRAAEPAPVLNGGKQLDRFKQRLHSTDDGEPDGDSDAAVGEAAAVAGLNGSVHSGLSGDAEP